MKERKDDGYRGKRKWQLGSKGRMRDDARNARIPGKFYRCRMNKRIKREVLWPATQCFSYLYVNKVERKRGKREGSIERERRREGGAERGKGEAAISLHGAGVIYARTEDSEGT